MDEEEGNSRVDSYYLLSHSKVTTFTHSNGDELVEFAYGTQRKRIERYLCCVRGRSDHYDNSNDIQIIKLK